MVPGELDIKIGKTETAKHQTISILLPKQGEAVEAHVEGKPTVWMKRLISGGLLRLAGEGFLDRWSLAKP